ncbi:TetR/AcrR family transcriptional regulator [Allomuricauda sp. F6463D]|uniref:TetR/AcrR family transcriptional regulator n=1 Tax=Allomuricauda sp. F6463D TaxID=2926409 RepID=UPI001FF3C8BA|nr:TetR/AcrR family transcriptional regulator [Muricauda sp. F6463D]MCK0159440.1 TetR/AcrR family transcriptional regulator [Muricauda sp. F6463D]
MKTQQLIINKAIELFNAKGVKNVTLREIATEIDKSYGNVTYHFSTKEKLLETLFEDYNTSLIKLQNNGLSFQNMLHYFLIAPELNFDVMIKYLFFFVDYTEIKRAYPKLMDQVELYNMERMQKWKGLLMELQEKKFLKSELSESDLEFIMELSIGLRMYYFRETSINCLDKTKFSFKVNQLLLPYLSKKGRVFYNSFYS